jgi:dTDP-4-amino-4,6-dideoxygalactose transaminase
MIPFNDFTPELASIRDELRSAFVRVVDSGRWILSQEVEQFEKAWAEACKTQHAIGVGNGFDALVIGLRAAGIGSSDEIITTPMTALATVLAISQVGATPVLADIEPATALLDPESIRRCITPRTRALLPVHLYGNASNAPVWADLAHEHGLALIEDCAQSHLATVRGRPAGSFGLFGAFSFYPTKNLGAIGDAGALVTDDADLASSARIIRNYGQSDRYHHDVEGVNSRLDELQAALLSVRLRNLQAQTDRRRDIARRLHDGIVNPRVQPLDEPADPLAHVHHLFVVSCAQRDELQDHLASRGVSHLIHYPVPAHRQAPYTGLTRDPAGLAVSERHAATCLSLPAGPHLTDSQIEQVIEAANSFKAS